MRFLLNLVNIVDFIVICIYIYKAYLDYQIIQLYKEHGEKYP